MSGYVSFKTTNWTAVRRASRQVPSHRREALEELCHGYWYPIYSYLRHRGRAADAAADLTQSFFVCLLEGDLLSRADASRGRFRSMLVAYLENFLRNQATYSKAAKRTPPGSLVSLDVARAEERLRMEELSDLSPERIFQRRWAKTLVARCLSHLAAQEQEKGEISGQRHSVLSGFLTGTSELSYREAAVRLDVSEGAVKVAVHRLRRRLGRLLREEVEQWTASPQEADQELRSLLHALD